MSTEPVWINPAQTVDAVGAMLRDVNAAARVEPISVPELGNATALETLTALKSIVEQTPAALVVQATVLADEVAEAAAATLRADGQGGR
jgi:hypothetical protein